MLTKDPPETEEKLTFAIDSAILSDKSSFEIISALCLSGGPEIVTISHVENAVRMGRVDVFNYLIEYSKINIMSARQPLSVFLAALDNGKLELFQLITTNSSFLQYLESEEKFSYSFRTIKFKFQEPQFIETFELAVPYFDESVFHTQKFMNSLFQHVFTHGRFLTFMKYLFGKWPSYKTHYLSNLSDFNEFHADSKIDDTQERLQLLIFSLWPQLSLVYLMQGVEEGDLLHEIILLIMHFLIKSYL